MSETVWAVHELLARYSHVVDNAAWEELGSVFANDAEIDAEFIKVKGLENIQEFLQSFDPLRSHHTLNTITKTDDAGVIHAWSRFLVVEFDATSLTGDYVDEISHVRDGLRITKRRMSTRNRPEDVQGRRESFSSWA